MSQTDRIGMILKRHRGHWVAMTALGKAAGCWAVHSRIADLRKRGYKIKNRISIDKKSGKKHSYYMMFKERQCAEQST